MVMVVCVRSLFILAEKMEELMFRHGKCQPGKGADAGKDKGCHHEPRCVHQQERVFVRLDKNTLGVLSTSLRSAVGSYSTGHSVFRLKTLRKIA